MADHVTMDVHDNLDLDLDRQNKQGRRDRVTLLSAEVEAGGREAVADCAAVAADTSS